MELDAVAVRGEPRRHLALQRQDSIVGVGAGQSVEHRGDLRQRVAAAFQRHDGVGEARCLGVARNRLDFRHVLLHGAIEGGAEMLRADRCEGWRLAGPSPGAEEGIGRFCCGCGHFVFHLFEARIFQPSRSVSGGTTTALRHSSPLSLAGARAAGRDFVAVCGLILQSISRTLPAKARLEPCRS
jgi:hypothetical protein